MGNACGQLLAAANEGRVDTVKQALRKGVHVDSRDLAQRTPLILAARKGHFPVVRLLLDENANRDAQDELGSTALYWAAYTGRVEVVRLLLSHGASVDLADSFGDTPIVGAARCGCEEILQLLLDNNASVDVQGKDGRTALYWAASSGFANVVPCLLNHAASIRLVDAEGDTPVAIATRNGHDEIVQMLNDRAQIAKTRLPETPTSDRPVREGMKVGSDIKKLLVAAQEGKVDGVAQALRIGAHVNARDENKWTALMHAAQNGHADVVQLLLDQNASIDAQNVGGKTALYHASFWGQLAAVRLLLHHKVSVDLADDDGDTPLMAAALRGHDKVVELLLKHNVNINAKKIGGRTALHRAAFSGRLSAVRVLLNHGASIEEVDKYGDTPLMDAAARGHDEIVQMLLDQHGNADAQNHVGKTALYMAASNGHVGVVRTLTAHGASTSLVDEDGYTAIVVATQGGHDQIAQSLREQAIKAWGTPAEIPKMGTPVYERNESATRSSMSPERQKNQLQVQPDKMTSSRVSYCMLESGDSTATVSMNSDRPSSEPQVEPGIRSSPMESFQPTTKLLGNLVPLCSKMAGTHAICEDVLERLFRVQYRFDGTKSETPHQVKTAFRQICVRFDAFLTENANHPATKGFESVRTRLGILHDFHCEIDGVEAHVGFASSDSTKPNWKDQWEDAALSAENYVDFSYKESSANSREELLKLSSAAGLSLPNDSTTSPLLLEPATKAVVGISGAPISMAPDWFIAEHVVRRQSRPFSSGSFGKVYRGTWGGSKVVVKCVNVNSSQEKRMFLREAKIWRMLRHPHIVTFFGACHVSHPCFFVCEEETNGNLVDYLDRMNGARRSLVWSKLHEAALGLQFLHQNDIVHGDLKCNQILVSGEGVAKLTDFGLSFISSESKPPISGGAVRWKAPECLTSEEPPTFKSDVYSFGMCVVEALTNNIPWGVHLPDAAVIDKMKHHTFLKRPAAFESDEHWDFVLSLCAFQPAKRLELSDAIKQLRRFRDELLRQEQTPLSA
ncbi:hypothetical protein BBJ28_00013019 [Nothophytophthora sp. Chile5]|nr:hypothetical protein BBJ28_00013019 [Nothophytophthora sp. Chile5]